MTDQLKACPFCGANAALKRIHAENHVVECMGCAARSPIRVYDHLAVKSWNIRAQDDDQTIQNDQIFPTCKAGLQIENVRDAARYRWVLDNHRLPLRCSSGYFLEDGIIYPTANEAIDAAISARGEVE